mmetsp:Transcript_45070/g.123623  ORF Transcript_45070/g.123623 Transcript_45070/m.123623 type:complete len:245 (-) Transcript_45070:1469-2203(-)
MAQTRSQSQAGGNATSESSTSASTAAAQEPNEDSDKKPLVDYQNTTTWPSWAHRPPAEIGLQVRIFEVVEIQKSTITFKFGTFCHWTLDSKGALAQTLEKVRNGSVEGKSVYTDPHGFEHFSGLYSQEAFETGELVEVLNCPKLDVVNALSSLEESYVDRDLTVLKAKGGGGEWLYQFRKFKVHCAYAPEISDFPFDLQSIKVRSHAKCDVNETLTPLAGGSTEYWEGPDSTTPIARRLRLLCF